MSEAIQPVFTIDKVYVKDMSLEVPNAPQVFLQQEEPQVQIQLRTDARQVDPGGVFEVAITVTINAKAGEKTIFLIEVAQAGLFQIRNVPQTPARPSRTTRAARPGGPSRDRRGSAWSAGERPTQGSSHRKRGVGKLKRY